MNLRHAAVIVTSVAVVALGARFAQGPSVSEAAALVSPPPNALEVLWAVCVRNQEPECVATPTASPSPSPTTSSVPSATPTETIPTPSVAPSSTPSPTSAPTSSAPPSPTPTPSASTAPPPGSYILIARDDLLALPTSGAAWGGVLSWAAKTPNVDLSDLNADGDVVTLAKALVFARTGDEQRRTEVRAALQRARDSGVSRALELARGVGAYVLAADLIGYRDPLFVSWASAQRTRAVSGGPANLRACAQVRPNNWGTWCRSSLLIIDIYVEDDVAADVAMYRGWLGDRAQYAGFTYGDTSWQADPSKPVGINPVGATKSGHSIDGVLPDDQRRAGSFSWPPPCENYVAEAMQGATLQATVLTRAGYPAWQWSDGALGRAVEFKYTNGCAFTGDDSFIPFGTDAIYGTHHAGSPPSTPGKGSGYYDWLFQ